MIDFDKPTSVYRCFNEQGELLYVGISLRAATRLSEHAKTPWWATVNRIEVEHFESRYHALIREGELIRSLEPRHNKSKGATGTVAELRAAREQRQREPNITALIVSTNLVRLRRERQMSQADVARELGCTERQISRWETGMHYPVSRSLVALTEVFDCTFADLHRTNDVPQWAELVKEAGNKRTPIPTAEVAA